MPSQVLGDTEFLGLNDIRVCSVKADADPRMQSKFCSFVFCNLEESTRCVFSCSKASPLMIRPCCWY